MRVFPRLQKHVRAVQLLVAFLVVMAPALRYVSRKTHSLFATEMLAWAMLEAMTLFLGLIPFAAVMLAARFAKKTPAPEARSEPEPETEPEKANAPAPAPVLGRREAIEKIGGLAAFGATGALLGWGMARGRHAFTIDELVVRIPGLPKALDGYVLAQVSDIHVGTFVGERELSEGLSRIAEVKPDLVVATGDLVDFDPAFAPLIAQRLAEIRARDGVLAIMGNHDYYAGVGEVLAALERAKVETLVNRGKVIRPNDGGGFALLGVDDMWAERSGGVGPDLDRAIATVPPDLARILLAHQPNFVRRAAGKVALQLSGHTHGGQINPGFTPAAAFLPYVSGRYERNGTTLYVNRGFGVVGPPARIGAPPEITKIVLVSA
jgi:predicted MPP superfamily phosphohydrolase